jgi:hypothetical protein
MQLHVDVQCSLRSVLIDTDWREYVHLTYHGNIFSYVSCKKKTHMMWRPKSSVFAWLKTHFSSNVVQDIIQQYILQVSRKHMYVPIKQNLDCFRTFRFF